MGKAVGLTLRAKARRESRGAAPKAAACRAARLEGRVYVQRRSLLQQPLQAQEATAFDEAEIKHLSWPPLGEHLLSQIHLTIPECHF